MKIKKILFAILAIVALSACNKDEVLPENELQGDAGYLVLNLDNPVFSKVNGASYTRTSGSETDNGTEQENKINSITVVLTDASGVISFVANPSITNSKIEKIKVALGQHYVYAIANNPIIVSEGQNINQVFNFQTAINGFKDGSLLMTNQRNSSLEQAGILATVTKENSITNPSRVTINVDHTACKISDETTDPTVTNLAISTNNIIDNVEIEGFSMLNVNKEFNLIQMWGTDNATGISLNSEVLSTPFPSTALVADQYIHNIGTYTILTKDGDDNIISITDNTVGKTDVFNRGPVYIPENRPTIFAFEADGITAGRGETTGVIYKVQAKKGSSNLETFYKYKNVLSEDLADIQALPDFTGKTLSSLSNSDLRALNIRVYEDGVMYYSHFIRDTNEAYQYDNKNYYGVFRNTSYKLKVNSISQIGDDVPGGIVVDPSKTGEAGNPTLDTKEAYIEISVTVNPWILNIVDIEF
jgi:hypothetical protein